MRNPDPLACDADALIDAVIDREGRYVNHPAEAFLYGWLTNCIEQDDA